MSRELVERYVQDAGRLRAAVVGLSEEELQARHGPGNWSIHELVIHVVDSDFVGTDRMKRVIAEENPPLVAFDENLWIERQHPHEQSLDYALILFEAGRRQMGRILMALPADAFDRAGMHSERGPVTLRQLVQTFVDHLDHHLRFLREKRENLGKPLSTA
jgi:uncharacterized damage-inducible protein DinB